MSSELTFCDFDLLWFQDVRPAEEYVVSHLPTALQLDPDSHDMEHVKCLIQRQIQGTDDTSE